MLSIFAAVEQWVHYWKTVTGRRASVITNSRYTWNLFYSGNYCGLVLPLLSYSARRVAAGSILTARSTGDSAATDATIRSVSDGNASMDNSVAFT